MNFVRGRAFSKGIAEGKALVTSQPISFLGGVDPSTGLVIEKNHELSGQTVAGRVLVFPHGKGSTVGTYIIYQLSKNGRAPCAIINRVTEPIVAVGAIISGIPAVDKLEVDPIEFLKSGQLIEVNGTEGFIKIL
jgi:predicted aconitase with swiveling domain